MLAYIVTLRNGRRYTVRATEVRANPDGGLELLASTADAGSEKVVVAVFDRCDVLTVIAREHLISEEPGEPLPQIVHRNDPIPF
jgi:hypothetical protein